MILATIVFTVADESYAAELSDEGWSVRGDADLTARLNSYWPLSTYGPADGEPVWRIADDVADLLHGVVTYRKPKTDRPPGTVF